MSTKTLYTCAWGGYWEKYGKEWISQVEQLNTKPDQVFVVSDKPLSNCSYDVILANGKHKPWPVTVFRQAAIDNCTSDWLCPIDIDDIMFPNYLDNINDEYDIHSHYALRQDMLRKDAERRWKNLFLDNDWKAPLSGVSFIKINILKDIKISNYGFQDKILAYDLRLKNATVFFDDVTRYEYVRVENSLSTNETAKKIKTRETKQIYEQMRNKVMM